MMEQQLQFGLTASIIFIAVMCILELCICMATFYDLYMQDSSSWINKIYKHLTMITMILFVLSSIGDCIHLMVKFYDFPNRYDGDRTEHVIQATTDGIYFFGNVIFYILLLLRISKPFQLNTFVFYFLTLLILLSVLLSIVYCFIMLLPFDLWIKWIKYAVIPLSINDFILNSFILCIFIYKMRKMIVNIEPTTIKAAVLISSMTKNCILFGFAIVVNQGFFAAIMYDVLSGGSTGYMHVIVDYCIPYCSRAIETITNICVLWLILQINYDKYINLCKCCHLCVARCIIGKSISSHSINCMYIIRGGKINLLQRCLNDDNFSSTTFKKGRSEKHEQSVTMDNGQ
eukprot:437951_1